MTIPTDKLRALIQEHLPGLIDVRHDLHAHPELGYAETRTSGVVQRELEQSNRADTKERARLVALLGRDGDSDASLTDLNEELAARIRDGSLAAPREELLDHLRETLRDKLAIANPKVLSE